MHSWKFQSQGDTQIKTVFSRPVDHLSPFMSAIPLTPPKGETGLAEGVIYRDHMLPRTWHCSVVIGLASHCADGLQTHHSSLLCCISVDSGFNGTQRTMTERGSRRSGGGKGRKPLSARWCPYGYLRCKGHCAQSHTDAHTHYSALAVTNCTELRNVCTWKVIIKKNAKAILLKYLLELLSR